METRLVIITVNTLLELFKSYIGTEDLPADARAVGLMLDPSTKRACLVAESAEWKHGEDPIEVKFDLRRVFGV